jgi:hypothetical protein
MEMRVVDGRGTSNGANACPRVVRCIDLFRNKHEAPDQAWNFNPFIVLKVTRTAWNKFMPVTRLHPLFLFSNI